MPTQEERMQVALEIEPNPASDTLPYRVKLTDLETGRTLEASFTLDLERLASLSRQDTPTVYGEYLFEQVFRKSVGDDGRAGKIADRLYELVRRAEDEGLGGLALKLEIATSLGALNGLAWETLFDSQPPETALAADLRLSFFRDIDVDSPRRSAIKEKPKVLVCVVCPSSSSLEMLNQSTGLALQSIPVEEEQKRLKLMFETLRSGLNYHLLEPQPGQSTRDQLAEALADGMFHVLHLSCHGIVLAKRSYLVLTKADGQADLVSEEELAELLSQRKELRLVLLNACQSAQLSQEMTFSGLVTRLMQRVPAAIGMLRPWYTGIADKRFTERFYSDLCRHGYVDRALQSARQNLRQWRPDRWEWSTPVLYLRLGKGQLFRPGVAKPRPKPRPAPPERGRGGAGLRIGPGATLKDVEFDVQAAGGTIYEGEWGSAPEPGAPGTGIEIFGAKVENIKVKGQYAGGGIYRQSLAQQAAQPFGRQELLASLKQQIAYYQQRLAEMQANPAAATRAAELLDLEDELRAMQETVKRIENEK